MFESWITARFSAKIGRIPRFLGTWDQPILNKGEKPWKTFQQGSPVLPWTCEPTSANMGNHGDKTCDMLRNLAGGGALIQNLRAVPHVSAVAKDSEYLGCTLRYSDADVSWISFDLLISKFLFRNVTTACWLIHRIVSMLDEVCDAKQIVRNTSGSTEDAWVHYWKSPATNGSWPLLNLMKGNKP